MRHQFGGSPADYAAERVGNQLLLRPGATGTAWTARTGGTQITDLTDLAGTPIAGLTADSDGAVAFMGPDNDTTSLYVDFGYGRRYCLTAVDTGARLAEFIASGGTAGGWAQLDETGTIDPGQIPAQLDWIVASTHGAKGDGATDDTIALQNAINACAPGGVVYLPRGVYRTTATLDLKNGVSLVGSHANMMVGPGMTDADYPCYIQPTAPFTGGSVIEIIGEDDGQHPAISGEQRLVNLMLDGSQLTGSSIDGVFAKGNVQNVVMDNFTVRQMPNNGLVTGEAGGVFPYSWRLRHVMIDNCHANGILFAGNTDLTLDDVQVIGCWAQGIVLTNITNGQLIGCRTEWNGSHGYHITGTWGDWQGSGGMQMTSCSTDRNGQHGVMVDATGNTPILVTGLMTRRDGRNGGEGGGGYAGLAIIGATTPVTVNGVTCYPGVDDGGASTNSPQYGVRLSGASTVMLDDAYLHAANAGLFDDGTNAVVSLGSNVTTVAGATTAAARTVVGRAAGSRYRAPGVYVPDGWGKAWLGARNRAVAGAGLARIVTVGGSATLGYFASNPRTKSWPGLVAASLRSAYGDGGSGFQGVGLSSTLAGDNAAAYAAWVANGSAVGQTGTWTQGGSNYGPGGTYIYSDVTGNTLTFKARGTTVKIYTVTGSGTRPAMLYSIDGAADVSVAQPSGTAAIQTTTVTGLSDTEHTVVVKVGTATTGQYLSVCGVSGEKASGIVLHNVALGGATSARYANATPTALNAVWNGGTAFPADLAVYSAAPNDASGNVTADTWVANVLSWHQAVWAAGLAGTGTDVVIALPHVGTHEGANGKYIEYSKAIRPLADIYGFAVVNWWVEGKRSWDWWNSLGYWGTAATPGAGGTDSVHLSDAGFQHMADLFLPLVAG
ncbi:right-handed parallel beta-helix repeat-containing protein [Streptomyces olivaceus]|uniref:glycosyl hydrolase family 28-related protein n=1 Tax=Streptomyces olivaceus TaxID=47716 RepID=UPI0021E17F85|nr:glycosyl hydrolase family 28-related protein [Streptomyces olivaceus]MBZ6207557.1 right-handed parallel beta-helix repeat-containing protein [Streptomyces olivaceus]